MTTSYYIDKAIHAINTDQPNLAMLYMRRGIRESKEKYPNPGLDLKYGLQALAEGLNSLTAMFEEVAKVFAGWARGYQDVFDREFYELVADNEG